MTTPAETLGQNLPAPAADANRSKSAPLRVSASSALANSRSLFHHTARFASRRESIAGILCSFLVHASIVGGMTLVVMELTRDDDAVGLISGVMQQSPNELEGELVFETPHQADAGGTESATEVENLIEELSASHARRMMQTSVSGLGDGTSTGEGSGDDSVVAVPSLSVPSYAVTQGSFSAWTVPEDPEPEEDYVIHIAVRLPEKLANSPKFRLRDISGMVVGTDGYKQVIQYKSNQTAMVEQGAVHLTIPVYGARKKVRDTIRIESKLLKEKQIIHLEF